MTIELPDLLSAVGADTDVESDALTGRRVLWGVAPTGDIHLGYAAYFFLLRRLKSLGAEIVPLIANYHGYLDSNKTAWSVIEQRCQHYRQVFSHVGFPAAMETRAFYLSGDYVEDLFRFSSICRIKELLGAGVGTLRTVPERAALSDVLYIATQILDVSFLNVDIVMCGIDESPIYRFGLPLLQKEFQRHCSYIYLPACPGVLNVEMHASDHVSNKILLSDSAPVVAERIRTHLANSVPNAPLLDFCVKTLFPLAGRQDLSSRLHDVADIRGDTLRSDLSDAIFQVIQDLNVTGELRQ